jgi:hypothetical protein
VKSIETKPVETKSIETKYAKICLLLLACSLCLTCSSFPQSRSWSALKEDGIAGTVWVAAVKADKAGGWSSVENEAAALLPLIFLEQRLKAVGEGEDADYVAELSLREREFSRGWKNRTSLSVELRLWPAKAGARETALPLAAGQVLLQGEDSFSSSGTLGRLLRKAVEQAVRALPKSQVGIDAPLETGKAAAET